MNEASVALSLPELSVSERNVEVLKYKPPTLGLGWEEWIRSLRDVREVIDYWVEDVKVHLEEIEEAREEIAGIKVGIRVEVLNNLNTIVGELKHNTDSIKELLERLEERYLEDLRHLIEYVDN
jgi:hypothetical protein